MKVKYLRVAHEHILALLSRLLWAVALALPVFGTPAAVVFTSLHSFNGTNDGAYPAAGLVQGSDNDVRVAKQGGYLLVHVLDHGYRGKHAMKEEHEGKAANTDSKEKNEVEIKVPMKVIDALFSAGKDELDLVAALHALSAAGDTELVSVKDRDNTVRVWLDSKNVTE